jgi:hypothetical protein
LFFCSLHFSLVFSSVLMLSQLWVSIKNSKQIAFVKSTLTTANESQKFNTQTTLQSENNSPDFHSCVYTLTWSSQHHL